jgi:hypothetical protein
VNLVRHYNIEQEYKINPITRQGKNLPANGLGIRGSPVVLIGNFLLEKNPGIRILFDEVRKRRYYTPQPTKSWKNNPSPLLDNIKTRLPNT